VCFTFIKLRHRIRSENINILMDSGSSKMRVPYRSGTYGGTSIMFFSPLEVNQPWREPGSHSHLVTNRFHPGDEDQPAKVARVCHFTTGFHGEGITFAPKVTGTREIQRSHAHLVTDSLSHVD
jgi:hypothetical protein